MQRLSMKQVVRIQSSIAALLALASVMILAGTALPAQLAQTAAQTGAAAQVIIDNYAFNPASLTVKVGTTVTWINHDDDAHTVVSTQGKFKSGLLNKNGSFEFRFTAAGEYPYKCGLHPKMTGTVTVQP